MTSVVRPGGFAGFPDQGRASPLAADPTATKIVVRNRLACRRYYSFTNGPGNGAGTINRVIFLTMQQEQRKWQKEK